MVGTMTVVGLDVHARSTQAAAIDVSSGELRRARFGVGSEEVVAWLSTLPAPVRGCYEAGPTGFSLYRAAEAAGVRVEVVAPSKTPRAAGERVKTDRKDAELLARLLLAGQLAPVGVPSPDFEAARHLTRAREQLRGDLMRARHRVSKLLLLHGRVYVDGRGWTKRHRRWLERQRFEHAATELAYVDALAAVDGLVARQAGARGATVTTGERGRMVLDGRPAALLPRHRHAKRASANARNRRFRALPAAAAARQPARTRAVAQPVRRHARTGRDHQDRLGLRAPAAGRGGLAVPTPA